MSNTNVFSRAMLTEDLDLILRLSEADFCNGLRGERILVTGGTGFFGKWLTQTLIAANDKWALNNHIALVTRDRSRALRESPWLDGRPEVSWIEADIRNLELSENFSTIIHGAAAASRDLNENRPDEMFNTIVDGTKAILALAEKSNCRRFLFISSGAVYGVQPADIANVDEKYSGAPDPLDAKSAYAEGKRAAEFLAATAASRAKFELKIARCYAFVGPYLPLGTHFAAGNFIGNILQGEAMKIGGDGTPLRSYLYAADLMVWLVRILVKGTSHRAYNVGSDQSVSIRELAETVHKVGLKFDAKRNSLEAPILIAKQADPNRPREQYVPSTARAQDELGLEAWTPLNESVSKTLRWLREGGL